VASLNPDALPKLRVNRMYADILAEQSRSVGRPALHQLQEARWLIKNVQQRFETILRVSQAIVDRQRHFFEHARSGCGAGAARNRKHARPARVDVSRVTTQKFMFTPRGIFELKYSRESRRTETGACSATAIRRCSSSCCRGGRPKTSFRTARFRDPQPARHLVARRTSQVPGVDADSFGEHEKSSDASGQTRSPDREVQGRLQAHPHDALKHHSPRNDVMV